MEKQHLTYFKIENFKRFDSFEMSNLGQFNLIVGDNNVGKTSVLEALCYDSDITNLALRYLYSTSIREGKIPEYTEVDMNNFSSINTWERLFKEINKPIVIRYLEVSHNNESIYNLKYKISNQLTLKERSYIKDFFLLKSAPKAWLSLSKINDEHGDFNMLPAYFEGIYIDTNGNDKSSVSFITASQNYGQDLVDFYYSYINGDKDSIKSLQDSLRNFITDLEEVRVHKYSNGSEILGVFLTKSNDFYPITRYGDGSIRFVRVIIEVILSKGKRIMIDEMGSGIHFSRLKDFWRIIIELCFRYQVQLFTTTHSLECQQAFIEALQDDDMKQFQADARNITMFEDKEGQVKSVTYTFEEFEFSIENNINTRGGRR
ncbi:AAA family ATPase [Larkinella punicea]|uniref:ATPase n=1 Tax=Larkinella punicea TaxID=2315727 RepID=A0A368JXD7_9BACT|nr:ATP-binding protein [Larkinella punicea]RCR70871.1 ATPase [Larkinella punicea]